MQLVTMKPVFWLALILLVSGPAVSANEIIDNGLAPPTFLHAVRDTQLAPRCRITARPLNLLIILDSSGSLRAEFEEERQVVRDIVKVVTVHSDYTRVALVQYSGYATTEFNFNRFNSTDYRVNAKNMLAHIDGLRFINGITKTGNALFHALKLLNEKEGWRRGVETVAFLVSDGRTFDHVKNYDVQGGNALRSAGADIYAYGTGEYVAFEELVEITKSVNKVFSKSSQEEVKRRYADMLDHFKRYEPSEECEEVPVCVPGSDRPLDLLYIIDGSGSIRTGFDEEIRKSIDLLNVMNVHPDAVRVAAIQFASKPRLEFGFSDHVTNEDVTKALRRINYMSGSTRTNEALRLGVEIIQNGEGRRRNVPAVVIVMTDGHAQHKIDDSAARLKQVSREVFAIAYGPDQEIDYKELYEIVNRDWSSVYTGRVNGTLLAESLAKYVSFSCPGIPGAAKPEDFERVMQHAVTRECGRNQMTVTVRTRKPFNGRLYVRDHFSDRGCYVDGDGRSSEVKLTVSPGQCGIQKHSQERGQSYKGMLILQFHTEAVTQAAEYIPIDCFYKDDRSLQRVGNIVQKAPEGCTYRLRKFSPDGCVALDATIGEKLYHTWACEADPTVYGFLVHSCVVEDSDRRTLPVLDRYGCTTDPYLFTVPNYFKNSIAYMESQVWRFPNSHYIRFRCKVQICDRASGQCDNKLPPQCDRRVNSSKTNKVKRQSLPEYEVETRWVNVLEPAVVAAQEENNYCGSY